LSAVAKGEGRKEISPNNLHISSFVLAKKKGNDQDYSILLLKAGNKHPLSFRRGKLLLPSTILRYGEKPRDAAKRALVQQLTNAESLEDPPRLLSMQSYYAAHWDIVFLWETWVKDGALEISAKEPYVEAKFYPINDLPRNMVSEDHLDVIDEMLRPSEATS
jgi:ADP-ribose pyrophosphatase YjhB (NUDIX family)